VPLSFFLETCSNLAIRILRLQGRDFSVSRDPEEWKHVENLMPLDIIPAIPEKEEYPSGFQPPRAQPGDNPYFVHRTDVSRLSNIWPLKV
jgi:hypothetical protein